MRQITYSIIENENEIEILRNRSGKYGDFIYTYDDFTIESLKKRLRLPESLFLIAKADDHFVAFCAIDKDWWEDDYFMIREIIVDYDFQRQGVGIAIMRKCIEYAKRKGATGVVTETAFENIPMQKLCSKLHFQRWNNPQWKEGITYKLKF